MKQFATGSQVARYGAVAAFLNALISLAMFAVAVAWIGSDVMRDPERMAAAANSNRTAFLTQDALKLASVAVSVVLIFVLSARIGLKGHNAKRGLIGAGLLGEACLMVNAFLSFVALRGTVSTDLLSALGITAVLAIVVGGVWLILVNAIGWRRGQLPPVLCFIGLLAGTAALGVLFLPPVSIVSLVLGITWSVWLGRFLWAQQ